MAKAADATDVFVGGRIKMRRVLIGMSQGKLADLLGITFQQVQKYEKGTNRVGASRLQMISRALGVPITFFFQQGGSVLDLSGIDKPDEDKSGPHISKQSLVLNQAFLKIKDVKIRKSILALAKTLADADKRDRVDSEGAFDVSVINHQ